MQHIRAERFIEQRDDALWHGGIEDFDVLAAIRERRRQIALDPLVAERDSAADALLVGDRGDVAVNNHPEMVDLIRAAGTAAGRPLAGSGRPLEREKQGAVSRHSRVSLCPPLLDAGSCDRDGIPDVDDACPHIRGSRHSDPAASGCPQGDALDTVVTVDTSAPAGGPDADGDGIPDDRDRCPYEPETRNGIRDDDGCPEDPRALRAARATPFPKPGPTTTSTATAAPVNTVAPHVVPKPPTSDASAGAGVAAALPVRPPIDSDRDGIPDDEDRCPVSPEDRDGFEDDDGCPDLDNDDDGIPDTRDRCPLEAETQNGHEDGDGCRHPETSSDEEGCRCPHP